MGGGQRRFWPPFLVVLVSLVAAVIAGEVLVRLTNRDMKNYDIEMWRYSRLLKQRSSNRLLAHEHVPRSSATLQGVQVRINSWGLRGPEYKPPAKGTRVILFLGSSVTLGWGVREKDTLTARLQSMFDRAKQKVLVLNAGIGNYNAARYVELFLARLKGLRPTDIVVHYFINDAEVLDPGGGNFILRYSQLAVTLWILWHRLVDKSGEKSLVDHYRAVYSPQAPGFKVMTRSLKRLGDYAKKHGVRLYLVMTPDIHNLTNYKLGFIHRIMSKLARKNGFRYLDLYPVFRGIKARRIWNQGNDPHPNARGHLLMARAIYKLLTSNP